MTEFMNLIRKAKYYKPRTSPQITDFKSLFRFEEENVEWLANHFLGKYEETRGGALSSVHKLKVCLRYLADPGFQKGIGEELGVEQSTVSRTVKTVVDLIVVRADQWFKFPTTDNAILEAKQLWQTKFNFPTALGALDCTHVRISKPSNHGDDYINRKGFASLNVQATCNAKYVITSVDCSWPGSVHDSRIWKNSVLRNAMARTNNTVIIADQGYGIEPWLMTPFRNPIDAVERSYNALLTAERVVIEQTFGQLKRRFPILQYICRVKPENVPNIVIACCILHNIAKFLGDDDFALVDDENDGDEYLPAEQMNENIRIQGQAVRQNVAQLIYNMNL